MTRHKLDALLLVLSLVAVSTAMWLALYLLVARIT